MIHTSSIKTMFDRNHIDTFHFGGSIKTYVIPCKYDQNDPFKSINGEYWILFYSPPTQQNLYFAGQSSHNTNFLTFIKRFYPSFALDTDISSFSLFKITASGDLAFVGVSTHDIGRYTNDNGVFNTPTLSLFTTDQLILDEHNNVTGLKQPIMADLPEEQPISDQFMLKMYKQYSSTEEEFLKEINKISPYYSLGGRQFETVTDEQARVKWQALNHGTTDYRYEFNSAQGIPVFYTADNIVFDIKKVYVQSIFSAMLPNSKNLKQLVVFHKISDAMQLDFYNENDEVFSKNISKEINTIEQVSDNSFQITKSNSNGIYSADFDQEKLTFVNINEIENESVGGYRSANLTSFVYQGNQFSENHSTSDYPSFTNSENRNGEEGLWQSYYNNLQKLDREIYINNQKIDQTSLREVASCSGIYTDNQSNSYHYFYQWARSTGSISLNNSRYMIQNLKNILPLYYEIGNWVIFPNHNILLPNSADILKSRTINNGMDQQFTYLYTINNNIDLVKITDTNSEIIDITGDVIKVNNIDSTTTLYSFRTMISIEAPSDSTGTFVIEHLGTINTFLNLDILHSVENDKNFIIKIPSNIINDYGSQLNLSFYFKQNDMIDCINADEFIKLTGTDTFNLMVAGKEITDLSNFSNAPYDTLKNIFELDSVDLDNLPNTNNTFITNLVTSQNSVPTTLHGMVVDGMDTYTLCSFPYQKINHYKEMKPVMNGNIASYEIDHFVDDDGTIYSKASIDFITLNINPDILDIEMDMIVDKSIYKSNINAVYTKVPYSLETFNIANSSYKISNNNLELGTLSISESTNVTNQVIDSTTLNIAGIDNVDHTFDIDLSGIVVNDKEEIIINVSCDSTGNISNELGFINIFDNVLYNDGIALSFNFNDTYGSTSTMYQTVYYDYISKDVDIQTDANHLIKDFDVWQYGQYAIKCLYYLILNPVVDLPFYVLSENALYKTSRQARAYGTDYFGSSGVRFYNYDTQVSMYDIEGLNDNTKIKAYINEIYAERFENSGQDLTKQLINEESFLNTGSTASTWLSNQQGDLPVNQAYAAMDHDELSSRGVNHNIKPLLQPNMETCFGICRMDATSVLPYNQTVGAEDFYIGMGGSKFFKSTDTKFYGVKISETPFDSTVVNKENYHEMMVIVNSEKVGRPDLMNFTIDSTSYNHLMQEISFETPYDQSVQPISYTTKSYGGLWGYHSDYVLYFNYELSPDEISFITTGDNKVDLGKLIAANLLKYTDNGVSLGTKSKWSLHDVNRNNVKIKIKSIDNVLYVYVNGHLYSSKTKSNDINLEKIRLFGNRWFGDKNIEIIKNVNVTSEYIQTYC